MNSIRNQTMDHLTATLKTLSHQMIYRMTILVTLTSYLNLMMKEMLKQMTPSTLAVAE